MAIKGVSGYGWRRIERLEAVAAGHRELSDRRLPCRRSVLDGLPASREVPVALESMLVSNRSMQSAADTREGFSNIGMRQQNAVEIR